MNRRIPNITVHHPLSLSPKPMPQSQLANAGEIFEKLDVLRAFLSPGVFRLIVEPRVVFVPRFVHLDNTPIGSFFEPVARTTRVTVRNLLLKRHHAVAKARKQILPVLHGQFRRLLNKDHVEFRAHDPRRLIHPADNDRAPVRKFVNLPIPALRSSKRGRTRRQYLILPRHKPGFGQGRPSLADDQKTSACPILSAEMQLLEEPPTLPSPSRT